MANPRLGMGYEGLTGPQIPVVFDSSIPLPTLGLAGLSVSPALNNVVTDTSASTYANPAVTDSLYRVVAGYGSEGNRVLGVIQRVEIDGTGTIAIRGQYEVPADSASPPLVSGACAVNGAGAVMAAPAPSGDVATVLSNCVCIGFTYSSNRAVFTHANGLISPPTANQQGPGAGPKMAVIQLL